MTRGELASTLIRILGVTFAAKGFLWFVVAVLFNVLQFLEGDLSLTYFALSPIYPSVIDIVIGVVLIWKSVGLSKLILFYGESFSDGDFGMGSAGYK